MDSLGGGISSVSKIGADAYKVGKQYAPIAGEVWKTADKGSFEKYGQPGM